MPAFRTDMHPFAAKARLEISRIVPGVAAAVTLQNGPALIERGQGAELTAAAASGARATPKARHSIRKRPGTMAWRRNIHPWAPAGKLTLIVHAGWPFQTEQGDGAAHLVNAGLTIAAFTRAASGHLGEQLPDRRFLRDNFLATGG
jgi:hypothetical protein